MPIDVRNLQFSTTPPFRHSDGSFKFEIVVFLASPIAGAPADIVATADIWTKTDQVGLALAEALKQVASQLPPEISLAGRN